MNSNEMEKEKKKMVCCQRLLFSHTQTKHFYFYRQPSHWMGYVWVSLSTLLWRIALNGSAKTKLWLHSQFTKSYTYCVHALKCTAHHHQKLFFSCTKRYNQPKATVRRYERWCGKKWSDENKLFHIIFFACFIASNAWMKCTSTLQAATTCTKNSRMKLFFFYTAQHTSTTCTHVCESTHILKSLLSFELALIEWKNRQRRDCRYLCYVVVVAVDTAVKLKTKPWLATNNSSALI